MTDKQVSRTLDGLGVLGCALFCIGILAVVFGAAARLWGLL